MHRHSVAPQTGPAPPPPDDPTRHRLIRAAVEVFDRKGYAGASVREIVERAGVTKPVLYYHFGSKEGMLVAVLDQAAERFTTTIARALERPGPTRERLLALGEDLFDLLQEHLPAVRVAHVLLLSPPAAAPAFDFSVFHRTLHAGLHRMVQEGFAGASIPEAFPEDAAIALSGVIGACASRQFHAGLDPVTRADLRRVLQMVFDGLLVPRPTAGASPQ